MVLIGENRKILAVRSGVIGADEPFPHRGRYGHGAPDHAGDPWTVNEISAICAPLRLRSCRPSPSDEPRHTPVKIEGYLALQGRSGERCRAEALLPGFGVKTSSNIPG